MIDQEWPIIWRKISGSSEIALGMLDNDTAEQLIPNLGVAGSNPAGIANSFRWLLRRVCLRYVAQGTYRGHL